MRRGGWLGWSLYSGGGSLGGRGGPLWWRASTATVARHFRAGRCGVGERERRGCSKVLGGRVVFQRERETRGREEGGPGERELEGEGGRSTTAASYWRHAVLRLQGEDDVFAENPLLPFSSIPFISFLIQWPF